MSNALRVGVGVGVVAMGVANCCCCFMVTFRMLICELRLCQEWMQNYIFCCPGSTAHFPALCFSHFSPPSYTASALWLLPFCAFLCAAFAGNLCAFCMFQGNCQGFPRHCVKQWKIINVLWYNYEAAALPANNCIQSWQWKLPENFDCQKLRICLSTRREVLIVWAPLPGPTPSSSSRVPLLILFN